MGGLGVWPYGVQVIFYFIPPYGVNGRCMIFGPMVYRTFFIFVFRHTVLMVGLEEWPYGVQGIFNFCIPPYGVNGRTRGMAQWCTGHFKFYSAIHCVNGRCIIFGPMVYRAFVFVLFRHTM